MEQVSEEEAFLKVLAHIGLKSVITVIYNLRNALFHGQIIPDKEIPKSLRAAYHILRMVVEVLG